MVIRMRSIAGTGRPLRERSLPLREFSFFSSFLHKAKPQARCYSAVCDFPTSFNLSEFSPHLSFPTPCGPLSVSLRPLDSRRSRLSVPFPDLFAFHRKLRSPSLPARVFRWRENLSDGDFSPFSLPRYGTIRDSREFSSFFREALVVGGNLLKTCFPFCNPRRCLFSCRRTASFLPTGRFPSDRERTLSSPTILFEDFSLQHTPIPFTGLLEDSLHVFV